MRQRRWHRRRRVNRRMTVRGRLQNLISHPCRWLAHRQIAPSAWLDPTLLLSDRALGTTSPQVYRMSPIVVRAYASSSPASESGSAGLTPSRNRCMKNHVAIATEHQPRGQERQGALNP